MEGVPEIHKIGVPILPEYTRKYVFENILIYEWRVLRFRTVVPLSWTVWIRSTQFYSVLFSRSVNWKPIIVPRKKNYNLMNHLKNVFLIPEFSKQIKIALSYSSIEYCARSVVIGCTRQVGSLTRGGGGQHLCMCLSIRMNWGNNKQSIQGHNLSCIYHKYK